MTEALKCPSCAAPLDPPDGNVASMRCPYCNTTVVLRGGSQDTQSDGSVSNFGSAAQIAEIAALVRAGKKIDAIKLFRQFHGADLRTAKDAIDQLAAGQFSVGGTSINLDPVIRSTIMSATTTASRSAGLGCGIGIAAIIFAAVVVPIILSFVRVHATPSSKHTAPAVNIPNINIPNINIPGVTTPAAPEFATMVSEFGAEGIGAGQFKDSRAIAIDNTGKIYVGEYSDGRVQVFDPTGKFLSMFSIGKDKIILALTADRQGNLFICTPGHITRYDGHGMPQGELENSDPDDTYSDITYMDAFAALNGDIFACSSTKIIDIGPDGKIKKMYDELEKTGERIDFYRIVVSGEGDIYCLDRSLGIFKFGPDGHYINRFGGGEGRGAGYVSNAQDMTIDGQGRLYVSGADPAVQVFDGEGRYLDSFGGNAVCFGMAINDQNEILGCFRNLYSVRKYAINKKPAP
jgi:hypothetical protein